MLVYALIARSSCAVRFSNGLSGPVRYDGRRTGHLWNSCPRPRSCVFSNARRNPGCSARLLRGSRLTRRAILTEVNDGHPPRWISRLKFPDSDTTLDLSIFALTEWESNPRRHAAATRPSNLCTEGVCPHTACRLSIASQWRDGKPLIHVTSMGHLITNHRTFAIPHHDHDSASR